MVGKAAKKFEICWREMKINLEVKLRFTKFSLFTSNVLNIKTHNENDEYQYY